MEWIHSIHDDLNLKKENYFCNHEIFLTILENIFITFEYVIFLVDLLWLNFIFFTQWDNLLIGVRDDPITLC